MSARPIMIMAGGTGGHVFPGLAVAAELRARQREVVWLGTQRGLEARLVPQHGIEIEWITIAGVRGNLPKGYRCIVSARDKALAALLGDSENPAHTEWQERRRSSKTATGMAPPRCAT